MIEESKGYERFGAVIIRAAAGSIVGRCQIDQLNDLTFETINHETARLIDVAFVTHFSTLRSRRSWISEASTWLESVNNVSDA